MNRSIRPEIAPIKKKELPRPEAFRLSNGLKGYVFDLADHEVIKIELVFHAGNAHEKTAMISDYATKLMPEGAAGKSANEIASMIDYYGAFLEHTVSKDHTSVVLYSLNKHLPQILPTFRDVLLKPDYNQSDLDILLQNDLESFKVNSNKVSVLCRRKFGEILYNSNSPYFRAISESSYGEIERGELVNYYNSNYYLGNCELYISGNVKSTEMDLMEACFGQVELKGSPEFSLDRITSSEQQEVYVELDDAIQSAIRIGKLVDLQRTDADYIPFQVLNTALGGYFSSRLMANIREDKGYTYGIGSGLVANLKSTTFLIATEVRADATADTVSEIQKEIKLLQENKMSSEEVDRVKNYMVGSFLRNSDGPFDIAERFKSTHLFGIDYSYYDSYIQKLQEVDADTLQEMAQKYLQLDSLSQVVVGKQ